MNKIKFLGTGGVFGMPYWNCDCKVCKSEDIKDRRLRSSLLVTLKDKNILIDFGPDCRYQLLKYDVKKLNYAFLTHAHADHMNGCSELALQNNLTIEMPKKVLDSFLKSLGSGYDWFKKRNPTIEFRNFESKEIEDVKIDSIKLKHQKDFQKEYTPCYGYVFRSKSFSFAYMSDYNEILEPEKLYDLDLIISDGCNLENTNIGHIGVKGSVDVFKKFKPKKMILTHINHTKSHKFLSDYVKRFGSIEIAFDGKEIKFK